MKKFYKFLKISVVVSSVLACIFLFILFLYSYKIWNSKKYDVTQSLIKFEEEATKSYRISENKKVRIFDQNQVLIGQFSLNKIQKIQREKLKFYKNLVWAILSSEDKNFYEHKGLDYSSILRAVWINFTNLSKVQGGSTITQQLAKMTMKLGERSFLNKLAEVYCTFFIENNFDKHTILSIYMNQIFLGEGNVGMEAASLYYFNKSATELSPQEAAMLVAIIPAPSIYNPIKNLKFALEKQKIVLSSMRQNLKLHLSYPKVPKFDLTLRKFYKTYKVYIPKSKNKNEYRSQIGAFEVTDENFEVNKAPDFNSMIRNDIIKYFSDLFKSNSILNVHTTLDYTKQKYAEKALKTKIKEIRRNILISKKNRLSKKIANSMNGSLVSINPENGFIETLVGSYEISSTGYRLNRAINASRQPGSTIKGLIYAIALENRMISPSTLIKDEAININGYKPKNWYKGYRGYMPSRIAFTQSVNTIAVKLFQQIGVEAFLDKLGRILTLSPSEINQRFKKNLTLGLGSGELTPLELSIIYATIANQGRRVVPVQIRKITNQKTNVLFEYTPQEGEPIFEPTASAIVLNFLQGFLGKNGMVSVPFSENIRLKMGGKSGTVQYPQKAKKKWAYRKGVKDVWFVGLIPNLTTVVWIGSDIVAPFKGSGSKTAAPVWLNYTKDMIYNTDLSKNLIHNQESNYILLDICGDDGKILLQGFKNCKEPIYSQYYYHGTEETLYSESTGIASEHNNNLMKRQKKRQIPKKEKPSAPQSTKNLEGKNLIDKIIPKRKELKKLPIPKTSPVIEEIQELNKQEVYEQEIEEPDIIEEESFLSEEEFIEDIDSSEQKSVSELIEIEKEREWLEN